MGRKALLETDMLPGRARILIQLYDAKAATYRQPRGFAVPGVLVENRVELNRLWQQLREVIELRDWTDLRRRQRPETTEDPAVATESGKADALAR